MSHSCFGLLSTSWSKRHSKIGPSSKTWHKCESIPNECWKWCTCFQSMNWFGLATRCCCSVMILALFPFYSSMKPQHIWLNLLKILMRITLMDFMTLLNSVWSHFWSKYRVKIQFNFVRHSSQSIRHNLLKSFIIQRE